MNNKNLKEDIVKINNDDNSINDKNITEKKNRWMPIAIFLFIIIICMVTVTILINPSFFDKPNNPIIINNKSFKIGVLAYDGKDTYVATIIRGIEEEVKKYEIENDVQIRVDVADSKDNQSVQNSQVDRYISLEYDLLIVNMVDRTEAATTIDKAKSNNIPIIFFNREPVKEDLKRWEKAYYVGFDAKKSGKLQAELILNKYNKNPQSIDKNNDGMIQYIILEGESRHQDSLIRTEKVIENLKLGGLELDRLQGAIADWSRAQAAALMDNFFDEFGDEIELIICNNDDMALGAIDVIKEKNLDFNNIVGVDATPQGIEAINNGDMIGTVDINAVECAKAIIEMGISILTTDKPDKNNHVVDNIYVWVDQKVIVSENQ